MSVNLTNSTATNKKISELYRAIKAKELILQPDFQRKFVWNNKHRKRFIETIIQGLPFPEIYIADNGVDLEKKSSQEVVVDGQQRLSTIAQYIDGELEISSSDPIKPFAEYGDDTQKAFLNYKVTVRELQGVDSETIKEIFRRINLTRYALNTYEIHHAIYSGEFITLAKTLAKSKALRQIPTFHDSEDTRMQDLGFMLLVMTTLQLGGYFHTDREIEPMIKKYDDKFPNKDKLRSELTRVAQLISSLKLDEDSIWYKRSNLFTLFVELSFQAPVNKLAEKLKEFENNIQLNKSIENKDKNDYSRYYFYTVAGTNSRQARVERARIFKKNILS